MEQVRFPGNDNRLTIVGRTGSGKTVAGAFHLSIRDYTKLPWVIINSKGDSLLNKISKFPGVQNMTLDQNPRKYGLHVVRPIPEVDDDKLQDFFWRIWHRGKVGIYADEGYMLPRGAATNALLTQGRSKNIPMIILVQKPVFLKSPFILSESEFFQIFELSTERDRDHIRNFVPYDVVETLPPYNSLWYDVKSKRLTKFSPVPDEAELLETIRQKVEPQTKFI